MASKAKSKAKGKKKATKKGFLSGLLAIFGGGNKKKKPAKSGAEKAKSKVQAKSKAARESTRSENLPAGTESTSSWDQGQQWDQDQQWGPGQQQWDQGQQQWDQGQQQWDQGQQQWEAAPAPQDDPLRAELTGGGGSPAKQSLAEQFADFDFTSGGGYAAGYHEAVANYGKAGAFGAIEASEASLPPAAAVVAPPQLPPATPPPPPPSALPPEAGLLFPGGVDQSLDSLFDSFEAAGRFAPPDHTGSDSGGALTAEASAPLPAYEEAFADLNRFEPPDLTQPSTFVEAPLFDMQPPQEMAFEPVAPLESPELAAEFALPPFDFPATEPPAPELSPPAFVPPPPVAATVPPPPPRPSPAPEPRQEGLVSIGKMLVDQNALKRILDKAEQRGSGVMTTTRVISAAKGQDIDQLLLQINAIHGVSGAIIVGRDGLVISSTLPANYDKEMVGAIASSMYSNLDVQCKKMHIGSLNWTMLETTDGLLMLIGMDVGVLGVLSQGLEQLDLAGVWMAISDTADRV